jgi:hypothetical protein
LPDAQYGAKVAPAWRRVPRGLAMVALAFTVALGGSVALEPQPAEAKQAGSITKSAQSLIGRSYRLGATGMSRFDCSGFVFRVYQMNGLLDRIGGKRRTASGYYNWFRNRGLVTKNPAVGDLVVWGKRASHIGIYVGKDSRGRPLAVSALVSGVARHQVHGINVPLRAYLRVNLKGSSSQASKSSPKASSSQAVRSGSTYRVKRGDTLSRIAKAHRVTLRSLVRANPQINNRNFIRVGQAIRLP